MTEYKAFSNTVVVFKEPTISQIVPKSGPNAGKETSVLEFKAYKPHFVKQKRRLLSTGQRRNPSSSVSVTTAKKARPKEWLLAQRRNDARSAWGHINS